MTNKSLFEQGPVPPASIALENRPSTSTLAESAPPSPAPTPKPETAWVPAGQAAISYDARLGRLTLMFDLDRPNGHDPRPGERELLANTALRQALAALPAVQGYSA